MKNLKKILMALVLVVLLISSAVIVAIAEASYTGSVAGATELLNAVETAAPAEGQSIAAAKSAPLAKVYTYLTKNPVNPQEEGYEEMLEKYNHYTLTVAYLLAKDVDTSEAPMDVSADLTKVYSHYAAAPVIGSKNGEFSIALGYKCANESCGTVVEFSDAELFVGLTEFSECVDGCSASEKNLELTNFFSLAEGEKMITEASFGVTGELLDAIFGSDPNGYYGLLDAQRTAIEFINNSLELEYVAPTSDVYTGDLKVASDMLAAVDVDAEFDSFTADLAEVYAYLVADPINPTTAEYLEFMTEYNEYCNILIEKLNASVSAAVSPADKIEILVNFRELLAGKAAVEEDAENGISASPAVSAVPFSERVVEAFNELRLYVMNEFMNANGALSELPELDNSPAIFTYAEIADEFVRNLEILSSLGVEDAKAPEYFSILYNDYIKIFAFDVEAESYSEYINEYKTLAVEYVTKAYIEKIANLVRIGERYTVLVDFHAFVADSPLCEEVVDLYNNARLALRDEAVALNNKIGTDKLPVYIEPESASSTVSYSVLDKFLSAFQDSYDEYIAASAEDKTAAFAVMQKSATNIYYYINGSVINTSDAEYDAFLLKYEALRSSVSDAIVSLIENAADNAEAAELAYGFVSAAPLSFSMVDAFNNAVAANLTEGADEYFVNSVYYGIDDGIAILKDADSTKDEILAAGIAVQDLIVKIYDVTDPKYAVAKDDFHAACEVIGDIIYDDLAYAITFLSVEELGALADYYFDYVDHLYTFETVMGLRKAFKSTADECAAIIDKINNGHADVAALDNAYVEMFDMIADFDATEGLEAKFAIYCEIYNKLNVENFNTFFISGPSYAIVKAEYDRVSGELEALLISLIETDASISQLCENLKTVGEYINTLCFSTEVVDKYNEVLAESIAKSFDQYINTLKDDCVALTYVSPNGYSTSFSRIFIALELAQAELDAGKTDFEEFLIAYRILSATTEYYGEMLLDFGDNDFITAITIFNKVTNGVGDYWIELINNDNNTYDQTAILFAQFKNFVQENPFSSSMVASYNDARIVLYDHYRKDASATFDGYQKLMQNLHAHLKACEIKESVLSSQDRAKYNVYKVLIEGAEYGEVRGYINHFDNLEGDLALLYQNTIVDKLNKYSSDYGLASYNDASLVSANLQNAFYKFVEALENEISSLGDNEQAKKINTIGTAFAEASLPSELIRIYNSRFGTSFVSKSVARGTEPGSLVEFGAYLANINAADSIDVARIAFVDAAEYLIAHPINSDDIQEDIVSEIEKMVKKLAENTEEAKKALNAGVKLSDYNLPLQVNLHHEDSKLYTSSLSPSSDTSVRYHTIETDRTGNKYAMIQTTTSTSPYFDLKKTIDGGTIDDTNSLVIELDVMSPELLNFQLAWTEDGLTYGGRVTTKILKFTNGRLDYLFGLYSTKKEQYFENYVEGVHDPIELVPGEWMHITVVMNLETMMYELLVDYVSLGQRPIIAGQGTKEDICRYTALRFQTTKAPSYACYDNVQIYGGTSYRTLDYFDSMTSDQKFEHYANYALDESQDAVNRIFAYTTANNLIPYITTAVDQELVAKFKSYDESDIRAVASEEHIGNLQDIVYNVDADALTSGTMSEQNASIATALSYIEANRLYIDQSDPRFVAINEELVAANEKIAWLKNLSEYIDLVARFHRATSHASLLRHYENVQEYYLICELNKADKAANAMIDPLATNFVKKMNADASVIELVGAVDFISYYTEYVPARIQSQLYLENSNKILDCVGFIESIVPNKDELTKDEFIAELGVKALENYDYVDAYMTVIRNLVNAEAYVPEVEGIDSALEIFNILDEIFFNRLQGIHYSVIKAQLDKYAMTSSYIEKAGICAYVENYIINNAVDMTDSLGVQYLYALEVYKAELATYKIDYEAILAANTESFLGIVRRMQTFVTYSELKPLYDLAIEKYYYNMNADSEEVKSAIAIFEKYEAQLTEWESNGAMLIGYSENLTARRQAQKYRALVNCSNYIDKVDTGVAGVAEVVELYYKTLAEYTESIEVVNDDISNVVDVVCSVRTESISSTILAIMKNLFN